jgi:hypothetical protein
MNGMAMVTRTENSLAVSVYVWRLFTGKLRQVCPLGILNGFI